MNSIIRNGVLSVFSFLLFASASKAQCDTVYTSDKVDELADFPVSQKDFNNFLTTKIVQLISEEVERTKKIIPSLNILFTISNEGDLIKVEFPNLDAGKSLHEKMAGEFVKLGKWKPATLNGKKVCSEFFWKIACIKWQ